ncbi:hypothetical protein [Methylophaga sp. OBS1]|uniref:hypothetical protein n=1 Tax=Methylophaga sp. OBS1 TaxID=2991933 RepID=UPI002250FD0E|nr:hypothetical protein [Methylophaga sp. OBS1]MCX4191005.1 hypothetical protein [Methylophaga sp. OBS1]MCX4192049.1 hypothetical protein [Methylophaga sp. OBS1]
MKRLFLALLLPLVMALSLPAQAEETKIMIRAQAVDAKFIGTGVGGVRVVVEDAETGEILDEGWINGGTGDTDLLVKNPIKRGQTLTDDKTAGFLAEVDLEAPRLLKFKLMGPYGYRQSLQEATVTSWVVPGKHLLGDGIILNMPGFIVDAWTQVLEGGKVEFYTKASLLCGCPITKDGLWKPDNYEVKAILMQDEETLAEVPLEFTGPVGMFSGKTEIKQSGHYKAIVYMVDPTTGNVGVDRTMFEVNLD